MKKQTKYHGECEITVEDVWKFDNGIPGFLDEKEFIILPLQEMEDFSILQSIKSPEIAFIIMSPFTFFRDYAFKLDEQTLDQLALQDEKDVRVMVILTVKDPFDKSTANLQAPVIFNTANKKAKQVILNNTNYKTRHPLFEQKAAMKG
ncbi:flagellar assembly protein FliW [Bacillus sp. APMAM]|nr:flagellar assembly protein FliW [Bacillus sp. APMAM]RTZ55026.1 flagellar assembly protein FliW [Bacillus sp. SAJ1]